MEEEDKKEEKIMGTKKWIFWVSIGTILIIIYKFFDNFSGIGRWIANFFKILSPFLVAILISYVLYKPCSKIEKKLKNRTKHSRGLSILIVYIVVLVLVAFILKFIIPAIFNSIIDLVNNIQIYYNSIEIDKIGESWAPFIKDNILKPLVYYIQEIDMFTPEMIREYVTSAIGAVKILFSIFISIICSIYILAEKESILNFIDKTAKATMSEKGYNKFNRYFTNGNQIFFGFIYSQFIDAIVVAILMSIVLLIMKVKYAVLLGIMIGIFNLIPYFGAIVAVIIAGLITILTGGWQQALVMMIIVTIVQQIDANVINPRITGSNLNVSPLLVIFSVTIGGAYLKLLGMFLAVPIAVLIKLMIDDYISNKTLE